MRTSKIVSLREAISSVEDGSSVAIGGIHAHNGPMAAVREIIRQRKRDLTLIPNVSAGLPVDALIGAGCVKTVYATYVGLEHLGLAPQFRKAAEAGTIQIKDVCEPFTIYAMKAGAASLPFMPFPRGHQAFDNAAINSDYRTVIDPYTGDEVLVVPPLRPDVGLIHATKCDPYGNVQIIGSVVQDDLIARSSNLTIVTTEEVVDFADTTRHPKVVTIPGFLVDMVVHVPMGAHPTAMHGCYQYDEPAIIDYRDCEIGAWLDRYIYAVEDHAAYLDLFGGERLSALRYRSPSLSTQI
jgi:glutaconate CoA-transferase subunit A